MISKKSLLISIILLLFVSNVGMAVMCARLKQVSAGENHTLVLVDDDTLWACGDNGSYQLGLGSSVYHVYSLQQVLGEDGVGYLQNIVTYDAGWYHSLAADANGTLWAWGSDDCGQLGNGSSQENWDVPKKVHGVNDVGYLSDTVDIVYVSAGRSGTHSLVVDSNGYVYAFGLDSSGQCGDGENNDDKTTPVLVLDDDPETDDVYLGDIATIIQADAGVSHSIALDDEGYVWHWGSGSYSIYYPEKVKASSTFGGQELSNIVQISSCGHSVAVDSSGNVWEWTYSDGAYKVPGGEMGTTYLEDIVEVSAGSGYSMARTSNGYVLTWNDGPSAFPEYVEEGEMETDSDLLEGTISIGAGYYNHKLAICENGYGWAWGTNNSYGKFGVGDTDPHPEPTQMLCAEASSSIYLTKTSEIQGSEPNCASPFDVNNYLVYEICYGNPITNPSDPNYYGSVYEVNIIDHLPLEVNEPDWISGGGVYDSNTHTVTWTIGELAPGDSNCFTLTTKVNNYAHPGGEISNFVEMTADMYYSYTTDTVPVCYWGSDIIYVDKNANGYNNGTNWDDAYTDLRDAFTGAQNCGDAVTAIWVAAGTYKPVYDTSDSSYRNKSFELLEGVGVFGHFVGTETSTNQRNFADANNETILDGKIGESVSEAVYDVLYADSVKDAIVDGFTITGSYNGSGIYLNRSGVSVVNCKIKGNRNYGIEVYNYSYPDIHNCTFIDNQNAGLYITNYCWPEVSNCIFDGNDGTPDGIYISNSVVAVDDSTFENHTDNSIEGSNGTLDVTDCNFQGDNDNAIQISDVTTTVTNCSIKNCGDGIYASNSDLIIDFTVISNSYDNALYTTGGCNLTLESSIIRYSGESGLELNGNFATTIINNWIHDNGTDQYPSYGGAGIRFSHQVSVPLIRNNTIYNNYTYGIQSGEQGADPNIINCIIYGNDSNDFYRENGTFDTVNYCCLEDGHAGTGNITGDPGFKNIETDPNDLHLAVDSNCIDAGDPNGDYGDETDIDGEPRVTGGRVDMGADEFECYTGMPDYDQWEEVGKPECWCYPRQCHGDADGQKTGTPFTGYVYVGTPDLDIMSVGWLVKDPPYGSGILDLEFNGVPAACADFAHDKTGNIVTGYVRIGTTDLDIMGEYWLVKEPPEGSGTPADCLPGNMEP